LGLWLFILSLPPSLPPCLPPLLLSFSPPPSVSAGKAT
jgi:hypothetical protein